MKRSKKVECTEEEKASKKAHQALFSQISKAIYANSHKELKNLLNEECDVDTMDSDAKHVFYG